MLTVLAFQVAGFKQVCRNAVCSRLHALVLATESRILCSQVLFQTFLILASLCRFWMQNIDQWSPSPPKPIKTLLKWFYTGAVAMAVCGKYRKDGLFWWHNLLGVSLLPCTDINFVSQNLDCLLYLACWHKASHLHPRNILCPPLPCNICIHTCVTYVCMYTVYT